MYRRVTSDRIRDSTWWWLVPFLAALCAYAPVVDGGFVWDDHALIEAQPQVQDLAPLATYFGQRFWNDPLEPSGSFYRPLVTLSYAVEWRVWSGAPVGFHLTNLTLHLGVIALLLTACSRAGGQAAATGLAAALFAVSPRLSESVAWISGRTDLLATLLGLSALLIYRPRSEGWVRPSACALFLLAAALSKEVAFVFFAALVALEWAEAQRRLTREAALRLLPSFASLCVALIARTVASTDGAVVVAPAVSTPAATPLVVLAAVGHYARMVLDALRPQFQIGLKSAPSAGMSVLGALVIVAGGFVCWRLRRRLAPLQFAALAAALAAFSLVVHLLPIHIPGLAADRFLYVPLAMGAVVLARPLSLLVARWPRTILVISVPLLLAFVVRTHQRVHIWNNEYALWKQAVAEREPGNTAPLLGLAGVLFDADLPERAARILAQQMEEERSLPQIKTWNAFAVALSKSGQHARAIALLEEVDVHEPGAARVRLNLAMANARARRWTSALEVLDRVEREAVPQATIDGVRQQILDARAATERATRVSGLEALVAQAQVETELGALFDAEQRWRTILRSPHASNEQALRALGQLAFHGEPSRVKADLDDARPRFGATAVFADFERVVADRELLR